VPEHFGEQAQRAAPTGLCFFDSVRNDSVKLLTSYGQDGKRDQILRDRKEVRGFIKHLKRWGKKTFNRRWGYEK
jgi:hypothetical protein